MNKFNKSIENIRQLVGGLPIDFQATVEGILKGINLTDQDYSRLLSVWLHEYIYSLPYKIGWSRKHIYLLTHCLLNRDFNANIEIYDILHDIESGIVGDCSIESLRKYLDEPTNPLALAEYVRSYEWL